MGQMFSTGENPSSENSGIGDDQVLVPTRFVWPYGGRRVFLIGSFTRWSEHVPMTPMEGCPTVFQTIYCLSPGYHQYKFYVDGEWRHDEQQPFVSGNNGIVNTVFLTGEPETIPLLLIPEISGNNDAFQRVEHTGLDCGPCGFIWRQISTCIRAVLQGRRGGDVKT